MPTLADQIAPKPKEPSGLGGWLASIGDEMAGAFARYGRRSGAQRDASLELLNQASAPGTDPIMGAGQKLLGLAGLITHPLAFFPTREEWDQRLQAAGNDGRMSRSIGGFLSDLPSLIDPQMAAGGAATVAPAIFAGVMAKTADLNKLKQAEKLAELGHSADDIRDMTGWFKGADSKWRFEIDDSKSYYEPPGADETFVNSKGVKHLPVDNLMGHAALFEAYPDIAKMTAYLMPRKSGAPVAGYSDKSDFVALSDDFGPSDGRRNLLHELQHAVQRREGFARGGRYDNPNYNDLAGEVEARNVTARADMTQDQRGDVSPWVTQDVPTNQQVLSFETGASYTPLLGKMMNKADDVADAGIIAYHGSPHSFDKFDMSKIGTGEGAQAYGHGLYFAENENVAGAYRNLAPPPTAPVPEDVKDALRSLDNLGFNNGGQALSSIRSHPDWMSRWDVDPSRSEAEAIASDRIKKYIEENPRGYMYQVKINVKPDELLDWDKPLSEQPEVWSKISGESKLQSQQAILADGDRLVTYAQKAGVPSLVGVKVQSELRKGASLKDAFASVRNLGGSIQDADKSAKWVADVDKLKDAIGSSDVSLKGTVPGDWIGAQIAKDVPGMMPNEIAETLKAKGVKGIRYKDAGSRGAEGGTYNYVIFDDKLITILKKYGIPMTAGVGGAMMVAGQDMPPELASQMGGT